MRYYELKQLLYIGQSVFGALFVILAVYQFHVASMVSDPFTHVVTAVLLLVVGSACLFFGIETYILRDDPDIWR